MPAGCLKGEPKKIERIHMLGLARQDFAADIPSLMQLAALMKKARSSHQVSDGQRLARTIGEAAALGKVTRLEPGASRFSIHAARCRKRLNRHSSGISRRTGRWFGRPRSLSRRSTLLHDLTLEHQHTWRQFGVLG